MINSPLNDGNAAGIQHQKMFNTIAAQNRGFALLVNRHHINKREPTLAPRTRRSQAAISGPGPVRVTKAEALRGNRADANQAQNNDKRQKRANEIDQGHEQTDPRRQSLTIAPN